MIARLLVFLTLGFGVAFTASALPRFAVQNGASCILCHVNPTGGGIRNDYGRDVFERRHLSLETAKKNPKDSHGGFLGRINDSLSVGGDLRFAYLSQSDSDIDADEDPDLDSLFL